MKELMQNKPQAEWLLRGEPREVQLEALRRSYYGYALRDHRDGEEIYRPLRTGHTPARGWGHLMEMRLGKTPTMLNEYELFRRDYSFERGVIFSPNSYKEDWAEEAVKYGLSVPAVAYDQSKLPKIRAQLDKMRDGFLLIVNYEALIYDQTLSFLADLVHSKTYMGADESIKLKNPDGNFFKGAIALAKNAGARRIATGLPMTQGPMDFYAQGRFICMYDGYSKYAYRGRFCKMGGFKAKKIVGTKNEEELSDQINANAFVAKRKDWGKQTDAEFYTMRVRLASEQAKHYKQIDNEFITWLDDGTEVAADQVMSKMMKLQQVSSGFLYDEFGNTHEIMDPRKTPKVQRLLEFMEEEATGKVVIPYHYSKSGDILMEVLAQYNPAVIRGDEWMRKNSRDVIAEKKRFNHDPACRVIILQLSAGKYGHDLTGNSDDRCATMVFFENNYSLDDRTQIEARNTTAFQTWANVYLDLVSSPIEKKAIDALASKENVVTAILGAYRDDKVRVEMV